MISKEIYLLYRKGKEELKSEEIYREIYKQYKESETKLQENGHGRADMAPSLQRKQRS